MANRGPFPEPNKQDTQLSAVNNADSNRANLNPPIEAQPIPQHTSVPNAPFTQTKVNYVSTINQLHRNSPESPSQERNVPKSHPSEELFNIQGMPLEPR